MVICEAWECDDNQWSPVAFPDHEQDIAMTTDTTKYSPKWVKDNPGLAAKMRAQVDEACISYERMEFNDPGRAMDAVRDGMQRRS
jgi:hypothetical protein